MRRAGLVTGLLVAAAVTSGCGSDGPPTVAFTSAVGTLSTGPAQYCDVAVTSCANHPESVIKLAVPPGQPLRISVPDQIASTPWHVVFSYRSPGSDTALDGRSPVFPPHQRRDYALTLPDPGDQLLTAQVQQFGGGQPTLDAQGEPSFPVRGSWVLATG
ncbi:MAG TPA: DUF2771 family protein [Pseudonocardia sp.]|jgi:hypothetical protein